MDFMYPPLENWTYSGVYLNLTFVCNSQTSGNRPLYCKSDMLVCTCVVGV